MRFLPLLLLTSCGLTHGWTRTTFPEGYPHRKVMVCFWSEENKDDLEDAECWSVAALKAKLEEGAPAPLERDSNEI